MKVAYVVHPVTSEQKQEIRAQGFKIIDAAFMPDGETVYGGACEPSTMKVGELRQHLSGLGIEFDPQASKAELLKLLQE